MTPEFPEAAGLVPGMRLGNFEIESQLGAGGMGEVWKARDVRLGRTVALKVSKTEFTRRFEREARATAALNHPHIATLYDLGPNYLVMEYVDGKTLQRLIPREGMNPAEAIGYAVQIADALAAAHAAGVVHRDLKPGNIMITAAGNVKVVDFGLARVNVATSPDEPTFTQTVEGVVAGTPGYMSPEQVRGQPLDHRSDIFSFGAVLYEMLTGERLFRGPSQADVVSAVLNQDPPENERIPAGIAKVIRRCLEKRPEQRFESAHDLGFALDAVSSTQNRAPLAAIPGRRGTVWLAGAALAAAVILIGGYLALRKPTGSEAPPQRTLTRLTSEPGLQSEPSWSPDGKLIAYSADRGGKFDIWLQPVGEGDAVQVTHSLGHNWQPDLSPDGQRIAFRSEREGGGLYVVPVLGGTERKIAPFGSHPRWSPDGSAILFDDAVPSLKRVPKLYLTKLDGQAPQPILSSFLGELVNLAQTSVGWHPDGKRVSMWSVHSKIGQGFWTVPVVGGAPVRSEVAPDVERRLRADGLQIDRFVWSPLGDALFFQATVRGVSNVWKIVVDKKTLRWISGPERLTLGPGADSDLAVSRDGKKLAYAARTERTRIWVFPFDANAGRLRGEGKPETPAGVDASAVNLSPDGTKMAYATMRFGKDEVWLKSLPGGEDKLLIADEFRRIYLTFSRDGRYLAYMRGRRPPPNGRIVQPGIVVIPTAGGDEEVVTSGVRDGPRDWFSDGRRILGISTHPSADGRYKMWIVSRDFAPKAEDHARVLAADPEYDFFQPQLSQDERWIVFIKWKSAQTGVSKLHAMSADGGEMRPLTDGKYTEDKPRWSPDGKTVYFLSPRGGFFNLWGVHFDPVHGKPVGEPFRVTDFENPTRIAAGPTQISEICVTRDSLALPMTELSGNVWVLENVDR
jgi:serine/threonine protein kinase